MNDYLAAVDIGGTKITVSIVKKSGIISKVYQPTKKTGESSAVPRQVTDLIEKAASQASVPSNAVAAVGISTASPFDIENGYKVLKSPNLCGGLSGSNHLPNDWKTIPLEEELSRRFRVIESANDCVSAVVAEHRFGAGKGRDDLIYVTWSTGIGAGALVDGHLLKGKKGNAMHLGHAYISTSDQESPQCGCGNFGDIESYASGTAIGRDFGSDAKEAFEAYRAGDEVARAIIENASRIFARGLASATVMLDTACIILGGSVTKNWDILEGPVKEEYYRAMPSLTEGVEIKKSALDKYLGDIAALSLVMPEDWIAFWEENEPWKRAPEMTVLN